MKNRKITGFTSQQGLKLVRIEHQGMSKIVPLSRLVSSPAEVKAYLTGLGLTVAANSTVAAIQKQIENIRTWESCRIASEVGWNGDTFFVLPTMEVVKAEDDEVVVHNLQSELSPNRAGKGASWKKLVASPLVGHKVPTFVLSFSFMPPLLDLSSRSTNVLFEIVSAPAKGKTTIQQLAASVWGCPSRNAGVPFLIPMDTTVNGLEETMMSRADLPLILDEANLFESHLTPAARGDAFRAIAFKLASGNEKQRYGASVDPKGYRLGALISTNDPLSELLQQDSSASRAAQERLLTIPIDRESEFGVFDFVAREYSNAGHFASSVSNAADANFGHAGRRFIKRLVADRAKDEIALQSKIEGFVAEFRSHVRIDQDDGSAIRISEAFGLVYAAGKLAKKYGCLPSKMDCLEAVAYCYHLNRAHENKHRPFVERLSDLIASQGTVIWKDFHPVKVSKADVILRKKKGRNELWVRSTAIKIVFPDWDQIKNSNQVLDYLHRDKSNRKSVRRKAGENLKKVKMYVFIVNGEEFDLTSK